MINDLNSFLTGVQVGLQLKVWEANATPNPVLSNNYTIIEEGGSIRHEQEETNESE